MSNESVNNIVLRFRNPLEREKAVVELSLLGVDAVGPLVSFLLAGPGNEHEPGCLAAEALELIGGEEAFDGLFTVLLEPIPLHDPVEELQQEAVRDCICHALQRIGDRRAVDPLLLALREYRLVGAVEALAGFGERRAVPLLVALLEDSFKRARVSEALLKYGNDASEELMRAAVHKHIKDDSEILPSAERRAEAAKLLGLIGDKSAASALVDLLNDEQQPVKLEAALSLAALLGDKTPARAVEVIKSASNASDLGVRLRVEEVLCSMNHRNEACPQPSRSSRIA